MLTVLIETLNDEERLARTLASLVGGAVEGVVREVVVCDRGSIDQTGLVADHAGCLWLEHADLAAGIRRARGDWLLLLEPGARLVPGWPEPVLRHASEVAAPARFTRSRAGAPRFLSRLFLPRRPLADGLLISKRQAVALAARGPLAPRGVRRLAAEIVVAPRR
ncbi:MAG: glycosyl transferase family 2 [Rhizobiaceae bacterium]|nr:glycosyl transferase family 2 [Rhizobiaceae bacterium]